MMIFGKGKRKEIKEALFTPRNRHMAEAVPGELGTALCPRGSILILARMAELQGMGYKKGASLEPHLLAASVSSSVLCLAEPCWG